MRSQLGFTTFLVAAILVAHSFADDAASPPKAFIDGTGPGWKDLGEKDFVKVNCDDDTFTWKDGLVHCTGKPVGVCRTAKQVTNFELVAQWRHLKSGGNSGIFVWASEEALTGLKPNSLPPGGIEVQVLDHGYTEQYEKSSGKKADWFTTHGDVFAVGKSKTKPFPPLSPNGSRSFPRKSLSKGINEWNHYYVRAINGEVRLWVNGEEVSGGENCEPRTGYLCLESEGSPVEFKNLRIRELPSSGIMLATLHEYRGYIFRIAYLAAEPAYAVEFPDVPEIITSGATLAEAFGNACEARDLHLESLQKLGKRAPRAKHSLVLQGP